MRRVPVENRYAGFRFADDKSRQQPSTDEVSAWERDNLLPWVPRPTKDICRTYAHIFHLLNDPRNVKLAQQKPPRKSVHVSVPRMPALPINRGASMSQLTPTGSEAQDQESMRRGVSSAPIGKPGRSRLSASQSAPTLQQDPPGSSGSGSMRSSASGREKDDPNGSMSGDPASSGAMPPSAWLADPAGAPGARLGRAAPGAQQPIAV